MALKMCATVAGVKQDILSNPEADAGTKSPATALTNDITDKRGYAARWKHSVRAVDDWLAEGLPHLKIGTRRVRIFVPAADQWMHQRFGRQRRKTNSPVKS